MFLAVRFNAATLPGFRALGLGFGAQGGSAFASKGLISLAMDLIRLTQVLLAKAQSYNCPLIKHSGLEGA